MKNVANYPLENITPFTLLDFPDITACILWFAGCNMKCQYCYNPEIVNSKGKLDYAKAFSFLETRKELLDGVVFSGGECTRAKGFSDFVEKIHKMGFKTKIDTNGSMPQVIKELGEKDLINYVALDFKAPPEKFREITKSKLFNRFSTTLDYLLQSDIAFEVRTTFHGDLLSKSDIAWMGEFLLERGYRDNFYIQHFVNNTETLSELQGNRTFISASDFNFTNLNLVIRN
jgi:pyruvate formate lyase activating enzyme